MTALLDLLAPMVTWAVVLWRLPRAVRAAEQRPLTLAFAALAVAVTLREPHVESLLREADLTFLLTVPKHLAGLVAAAAVLDFIAWIAGQQRGRATRGVRFGLAAVAGAVMLAMLPLVPRAPDGDFALGFGEHVSVLVYWHAWLLYLGTALTMATSLFWRQARRAPAGRLRTGLALGGIGTVVGLAYIGNKLAFMLLVFLPDTRAPLSPDLTVLVNTLLLNTALLLIIVGTTLPAPFVTAAVARVRDLRALRELRPLWEAITQQDPRVVLEGASGRRRERLRPGDTRMRLYRRTIEIRDGVLALRGHRQPGVDGAARRLAARTGRRGRSADAFVEACQWELALRARERGIAGDPDAGESFGEGANLDEEVRWLRLVARAHASPELREFADSWTFIPISDTVTEQEHP